MSTESLKYAKFDHDDGKSYASPMDVIHDDGLPHDHKKSILEEWKRRVAAHNRADGIQTMDHELDRAIERLAGLGT